MNKHMKTSPASLTRILFCWVTLLISTASSNCFGQDTIRHYPELKKIKKGYLYGDKQINEGEMQTQLVLLGNTDINKQIRLAKKSKDLQGFGYWAIPLSITATYYSLASQNEGLSGLFYGATFLVLTSSVYFKIDSDKKNAKALRLYKEYYGNQ